MENMNTSECLDFINAASPSRSPASPTSHQLPGSPKYPSLLNSVNLFGLTTDAKTKFPQVLKKQTTFGNNLPSDAHKVADIVGKRMHTAKARVPHIKNALTHAIGMVFTYANDPQLLRKLQSSVAQMPYLAEELEETVKCQRKIEEIFNYALGAATVCDQLQSRCRLLIARNKELQAKNDQFQAMFHDSGLMDMVSAQLLIIYIKKYNGFI